MRKTMIRFFTLADYEEEEAWLREQHRAGWAAVRLTVPCFYTFESCEPEDVIYRLDYKNSKETRDYMQMMKDFGWEYFERCAGWLYYRKPAASVETEEEGELFSDNLSRVEMVRNIVRTRLYPLTVIFLCCVIPNLLRSAFGEFEAFFSVFFGVMFVLYVYLIVYNGIKLRKMRKKYGD